MADEYWRLPYTAAQLQGAATNQVPRVGSNGNWEVWDIDTSAWVDTGVGAQGDGVTSFNGRQGAILPESGDYSGFYAPAGYGLGTTSDRLPSNTDLNDITANGFYTWGGYPLMNEPSLMPSGYCSMLVCNGWQFVFSPNGGGLQAQRFLTSSWQPWMYVNPRLEPGTEYRTIEKFNKKPVYVKAVSVNVPSAQNANATTQLGVTNFDSLVRGYLIVKGASGGNSLNYVLPYKDASGNEVYGGFVSVNHTLTTTVAYTSATITLSSGTAVAYYTKTTD